MASQSPEYSCCHFDTSELGWLPVSDVGRWLARFHNIPSKFPVTQTRKSTTILGPYQEFAPLNVFDLRNVKDAVGVYKVARRI